MHSDQIDASHHKSFTCIFRSGVRVECPTTRLTASLSEIYRPHIPVDLSPLKHGEGFAEIVRLVKSAPPNVKLDHQLSISTVFTLSISGQNSPCLTSTIDSRILVWPRLSWPGRWDLTRGLGLSIVLCAHLAALAHAYPASVASNPFPHDHHEQLLARAIPPPGRNSTLHQEIQCYLLPYGWIGIISHLLTYCQVIYLGLLRSPITWGHLSCRPFDFFLNTISLLATVPFAIWTIVRCRQSSELALVSVWVTLLVITQGCMAIHAAVTNKEEVGDPFWWLALYAVGILIGLLGIIAIVAQQIRAGGKEAQNVKIVTGSFGGFLGLVLVVGLVIWASRGGFKAKYGATVAMVVVPTLGLIAAFYSDLVLAAVVNHWSGAPHRYRAAYWIFFSAKRFPLFSV